MGGVATETALRDWRYGQTQAERLTAAILHLEEFDDVDPQHPLGGPDGLKDVLCRKDGLTWVAAAYFPTTPPSFAEIKQKFDHDKAGVAGNHAEGLAFFVNQRLTIGEREGLHALAAGMKSEVYHLERIRALLDAPKGCGIRLEYLRIPMTEEEQWAFWSSMNQDIVRRLVDSETRRAAQVEAIDQKLDLVLDRTTAIGFDLRATASSTANRDPIENVEMPTAVLTVSSLCWVHRLLTEGTGMPEAVRGRFRGVQVWVGQAGASIETATHVPPPPEEVAALTLGFVEWWRGRHLELRGKTKDEIVVGLAEFHHGLLRIHPFLDANGRVGRALLDQAARELLNQGIGKQFTEDATGYCAALTQADLGDASLLEQRILAALE